MYQTSRDANTTLVNRPFSFMAPSRPRKMLPEGNPNQNHDPLVENGLFVETPNPFNIKRSHVIYVNRLFPSLDESSIEQELMRCGCPMPFYIKINRGAEIPIPTTFETSPSTEELLLDYAKSNTFLPFPDKVIETYVKKDTKRKVAIIRAKYQTMDDLEMVFVTQPNMIHLEQPVRFQAQFKISLRIEKKLWQFRETQIRTYLDGLKIQKVLFRVSTKSPANVWLFIEGPRLEILDVIRKKVDEFLQFKFYKHNNIDLLFTSYGNDQLLALDVTPGYIYFTFTAKRIRVYGEEQERNAVIAKLDGLVQKLQALVIDIPLVILKSSLAQVSRNLSTYHNAGLSGKLRLSYNRILATGTEEAIEMLKTALKDHLVPPRNEINTGDCGLCFDTLINPISLQVSFPIQPIFFYSIHCLLLHTNFSYVLINSAPTV